MRSANQQKLLALFLAELLLGGAPYARGGPLGLGHLFNFGSRGVPSAEMGNVSAVVISFVLAYRHEVVPPMVVTPMLVIGATALQAGGREVATTWYGCARCAMCYA